jgi:hypothetical protein
MRLILIAVWLISSFAMPASKAYAARGMPDSTEFGYGAILDIWGEEVDLSIKSSAAIGLDWVRIDFDWERHWPDRDELINLERLDNVMANLSMHHINALLSLSHAPGWAKNPSGPDIEETVGLVELLVDRYPANLLTIELFPGANTSQGWGAPPDANAYSILLKATQEAMQRTESRVLIVAAGLTPLLKDHPPGDIPDMLFLEELYQAGAMVYMPILSLRLNGVTEDVMASPLSSNQLVFRHYESLRGVMLKYGHSNGLIWITGFAWTSTNMDTSEQIRWLIQALNLTKSQLYLGVAFFDRLNPATRAVDKYSNSLILTDGASTHLHPALSTMGQVITVGRTGQMSSLHNYLYKKMIAGPKKNYLKSSLP